MLSLRGFTTPARDGGGILDSSGVGATLARAVRPFIRDVVTRQEWALELVYDRVEHDRQLMLRGTSFVDGLDVFEGGMMTSYRVDVVGWILPS